MTETKRSLPEKPDSWRTWYKWVRGLRTPMIRVLAALWFLVEWPAEWAIYFYKRWQVIELLAAGLFVAGIAPRR